MTGWTRHAGRAIALPYENVDTDQLIPARFMSTPRSAGYGAFLLHDMRRNADGMPDPDFPLNRPEAQGASILVTRRGFGSGSSREAAVYALVDAGFRVIIAPSFGDIFAANAVNNGLLPALMEGDRVEALLRAAPLDLLVDLAAGTIAAPASTEHFVIDPVRAQKLMNGWDDIDLTRAHRARIDAFAKERRETAPWVWP